MKTRYWNQIWIILALIAFIILFTGCKSDPNETFIQGIWYYNDEHLRGIVGESQQEDRWLFDNRTFQNTSCCFVKTNFRGSYSILKSEENTLELELFDIVGDQGGMAISKQARMPLIIKINLENDTIEINRSGPYTRMTP